MKQRWIYPSPLGPLSLVATEKGLSAVSLPSPHAETSDSATEDLQSLHSATPQAQHLAKTVSELDAYFAGKLRRFTMPLDVAGTPFQNKVWSELERIPYGETRSYADIARRIRNDKATRAVGTANGRNPIPIIVPCHRVIASDGGLGGYSGGLATKQRLLTLETKFAGKHRPQFPHAGN
jgi:methylated-DNA-[protein]-cysteine S-methyltransferase